MGARGNKLVPKYYLSVPCLPLVQFATRSRHARWGYKQVDQTYTTGALCLLPYQGWAPFPGSNPGVVFVLTGWLYSLIDALLLLLWCGFLIILIKFIFIWYNEHNVKIIKLCLPILNYYKLNLKRHLPYERNTAR